MYPEDRFKTFKMVLKILGINVSKSATETEVRYYQINHCFQLFWASLHPFMIVDTIFDPHNRDYAEISFLLITLGMVINLGGLLLLFSIKRSQIESIIDKMELLITMYSKEMEYKEILEKAFEKSEKIFYFISKSLIAIWIVPLGAAYFSYYFMGITDTPVPLKVPINSKNHFHLACLIQTTFVAPYFIIGILCACFYSYFTIVIAAIFSVLHKDLRKIGKKNIIGKSIYCYQILIQIVNHANNLMQYLLILQHLACPAMITFCVYNFAKLQAVQDSRALLFLGGSYYYLINPLYYCYSGSIILSKNKETVIALYDNEWYKLKPSERKSLVVFTAMANKKLTFNFKGIVHFDLAEYEWVLKASYSFLAAVRTLDTSI